uniref:Uncharacterized protein n=1 Tax=Quercus lobata TaxID=97700 RepID=A0A7N2LDR5_QUELO
MCSSSNSTSSLHMYEMEDEDHFESISSTPMPDGNLNYNNILLATLKLFQKMYPLEEVFPETASPENPEDDNEFSLES